MPLAHLFHKTVFYHGRSYEVTITSTTILIGGHKVLDLSEDDDEDYEEGLTYLDFSFEDLKDEIKKAIRIKAQREEVSARWGAWDGILK